MNTTLPLGPNLLSHARAREKQFSLTLNKTAAVPGTKAQIFTIPTYTKFTPVSSNAARRDP
jgi:hypothetical protein